MNEFIVWDEEKNRFVNRDDYVLDLYDSSLIKIGQGYDGTDGNFTMDEDKNCKAFPYIGKTDINDKKIYADCSIFEFEYNDIKVKGVFYYRDVILGYKVCIKKQGEWDEWVRYNPNTMQNFKIIGTLQENPELLETK